MMTSYQIGGLVIFLVGLLMLAASLPFAHLTSRTGTLTAQIGSSMLNWLLRVFAVIVCLLGIVTFIQE